MSAMQHYNKGKSNTEAGWERDLYKAQASILIPIGLLGNLEREQLVTPPEALASAELLKEVNGSREESNPQRA